MRSGATMLKRLFSGWRLFFLVGGMTFIAFAMVAFTFALLLDVAPFVTSSPENVVMSLNANLVILLILALLVGYRIFAVFRGRVKGGGGGKLHARVALLFGLVATAPSIMLVIFSVAFLHVGLDQWFGQKVDAAVNRSLFIGRAYLQEHRLGLVRDTYAMGDSLARQNVDDTGAKDDWDGVLKGLTIRLGLAEVVLFDESGGVRGKAGDVDELKGAIVPDWAVRSARLGDDVVVIGGSAERVRSLLWLGERKLFLLVGRAIDPGIVRHVEGVNLAVGDFQKAVVKRTSIEARLSVFYILFGLVFVLASMWAGLMFAGALAEPISTLIQTADQVRAGDLSARVIVRGRSDEIGSLLAGFNRMTEQLEAQRDRLVDANEEMDERRKFIGAVLSGVTSGVVGVDPAGVVRAANTYAEATLAAGVNIVGEELRVVAPELEMALQEPGGASGVAETEVRIIREGRQRVLLARASDESDADLEGRVITFTDITDLVAAKRQAAWSGVARRVAHEIKNPLTPIQLAAERLKRKYGKTIELDPDIFALCCDTIVRQVDALQGMVDEFSEFARLPSPKMQLASLGDLSSEVIFLLEMEHKDVSFKISLEGSPNEIDCDPGQITRALNNILINAVHAVQEKQATDEGEQGEVALTVLAEGHQVVLRVEDTGNGFPDDLIHSVAEPYVTTKPNGSGLGLAIVQRIVEEHGGELRLSNKPAGSALVEIRLLSHGDLSAASA